ncbi:MAG: hemolysin family protein [Anaerolineales bacterium]
MVYISVALAFSFLCSIWEAAVLSSSLSYIEVMAEQGKRFAVVMRRIKENVEDAISAILTLNTIAHTVGAAGAGAQAAAVFGNEWFGVISAVLTFLILVFSEIIPKTLGAVYWKPLMPFTAYGVQGLIWVLYPAVKAFQVLGRTIASGDKAPTVTRSELEALAEIGQDEGTLEKEEHIILRNLFRLNAAHVGDIMTPRTVVFMLQEDMTVGEVAQKHPLIVHSRIPIYRENHDDVVGFVLRYQLLSAVAEDKHDVKLNQLVLPIHSVPESLPVSKVLREFITRREHIFLVLDEYGGTAGIVTMEDTVESLLGTEILDESDVVADMRMLAKQRYDRRQKLFELQITQLHAAKIGENGASKDDRISKPLSSSAPSSSTTG